MWEEACSTGVLELGMQSQEPYKPDTQCYELAVASLSLPTRQTCMDMKVRMAHAAYPIEEDPRFWNKLSE